MKRRSVRSRSQKEMPISWLPIDSRLFPHIFSFGHVTGIARIFLEVEIAISLLMVTGTLAVVVLTLFRSK